MLEVPVLLTSVGLKQCLLDKVYVSLVEYEAMLKCSNIQSFTTCCCCRNKIGQRWKLFTLKETAHNFDERLEMDLHTPSKLRDAVPPQILPAAAAPDAVEEWLTILQQYFSRHSLLGIHSGAFGLGDQQHLQLV